MNTYFPINERLKYDRKRSTLVKEARPRGVDARLGFLLPALHDMIDARVDAEVHSYKGDTMDLTGYNLGLTISSRDGVMSATLTRGKERGFASTYGFNWSMNLLFDTSLLAKGKNPFAAPYQASCNCQNIHHLEYEFTNLLLQNAHQR